VSDVVYLGIFRSNAFRDNDSLNLWGWQI